MAWLAVLNTTDTDLRFTGTDGIIPANDFGAVDDTSVVVRRGISIGALVEVVDASGSDEAAVAVARAEALTAGAPAGAAGLSLSERVVQLTASYDSVVGALDPRLDSLESSPHIELDPDGTPVVVSQGV